MNLERILHEAFDDARSRPEDARSRNILHRERSKRWVHSLGLKLQKAHPSRLNIRVFWRGNDANRSDFGLNELLYDISVCEVAVVESASQGKRLQFVRSVIWQIE